MDCPNCHDQTLRPKLTRKGVEIDYCPECKGIWLDKGEIFYFTRWPKGLARTLAKAREDPVPTDRISLRTGKPMEALSFLAGQLTIEQCPESQGLWFENGELRRLTVSDNELLSIQLDEAAGARQPKPGAEKRGGAKPKPPLLIKLPPLALSTGATLVGLYALITLLLIVAVEWGQLSVSFAVSIGIGIAALQFITAPWLMDLSMNWFYKMKWVRPDELPTQLEHFVVEACRRERMKIPRFGIIQDGGPNAFVYGHTPNNARIIITQGILDLLDPPEIEAVVAHEIGHARNWDMFLMTAVQVVPLISYYIYRLIMKYGGSSENNKGAAYVDLVGILAYLTYVISEYIVLWFSRTREYNADRFAGWKTGHPNSLATALVKIAYGLAGQKQFAEEEKEAPRSNRLAAVSALGISDIDMSRAFAVSAYAGGTTMDKAPDLENRDHILNAMKWDLWNPWAKFYELHSTHPLVASRLEFLSNQAEAMEQEPFIRFDLQRPESYWDEFLIDIGLLFMPVLGFGAFLLAAVLSSQWWLIKLGIAAAGALALLKMRFTYPYAVFPEFTVAGLLKKVKVSAVRAVPCTLKGKIIGRGVPGLIWSEDFIFQDESGLIFLDYRQPLRIWEFFFGLMRSQELQNREVTIEGWYRRSAVPYIELKTLKNRGKLTHCYVYSFKKWFAVLLIIGGLLFPAQSAYQYLHTAVQNQITRQQAPVQTAAERSESARASAEKAFLTHIHQGYSHYKSNRFADALKELDQAVELNPDRYEGYYYRGFVFEKTGEFDRAVENFQRVLEFKPHDIQICRHLDWLLTKQGRRDRVIEIWNEFLKHKPESGAAYLERGGAYYHQGNLTAARDDARKACELGVSQGCVYYKRLKRRIGE